MISKVASGLKLYFWSFTPKNIVGIKQEELRKDLLEQFNENFMNRINLISQIVNSIDKTRTNQKEKNALSSDEAIRHLEISIKDLYAVVNYWKMEINDETNSELDKPRFATTFDISKKIFNNLNAITDPKSKDQRKMFNSMEGGLASIQRLLKLS